MEVIPWALNYTHVKICKFYFKSVQYFERVFWKEEKSLQGVAVPTG